MVCDNHCILCVVYMEGMGLVLMSELSIIDLGFCTYIRVLMLGCVTWSCLHVTVQAKAQVQRDKLKEERSQRLREISDKVHFTYSA